MKIYGLQKLTLLDYPGEVACTVFLGGCNFRCPYCHNGDVVLCDCESNISVSELLAFLDSRAGRLSAVCISGGEPTLHSDLPNLIREIKRRGFLVKLDTNGTNPVMISRLIDEGLLDYVAMDIKNSLEKYPLTVGFDLSNSEMAKIPRPQYLLSALESPIRESAFILMQGRVDFEFRTTLVKELHTESDIEKIGIWLKGDEKFFLQTYREEGELLVGGFTPFTPDETRAMLSLLKKYIPNAEIR